MCGHSARIEQASRRDSAARWAGTLLSASMSKTRSESIHFLLGGPETFAHTQLPTNAEVIKRVRLGMIYSNKTKSSFLHTVADEVSARYEQRRALLELTGSAERLRHRLDSPTTRRSTHPRKVSENENTN